MQQQQAALLDYFHPTSTYFHYFRQRPKRAGVPLFLSRPSRAPAEEFLAARWLWCDLTVGPAEAGDA